MLIAYLAPFTLPVRDATAVEFVAYYVVINIAVAISDIIDVPVVNEDGQICESAMEMIATGERYLEKMNQAVKD